MPRSWRYQARSPQHQLLLRVVGRGEEAQSLHSQPPGRAGEGDDWRSPFCG
ncbi:MAG: hypothetical protein HC881_16425 [Leptolyngbyaceae cyanobacterium SL_7_1]|nr:hypothetical protein [Leptolyngbyaceae cyanobacterium SL_7_1]